MRGSRTSVIKSTSQFVKSTSSCPLSPAPLEVHQSRDVVWLSRIFVAFPLFPQLFVLQILPFPPYAHDPCYPDFHLPQSKLSWDCASPVAPLFGEVHLTINLLSLLDFLDPRPQTGTRGVYERISWVDTQARQFGER